MAYSRQAGTGKLEYQEEWLKERFFRHRGNAEVVRQDLLREQSIDVSLRTVERAVAPLRWLLTAEAKATVRFEDARRGISCRSISVRCGCRFPPSGCASSCSWRRWAIRDAAMSRRSGTSGSRRGFTGAILLLLSRLGLRAAEAAALTGEGRRRAQRDCRCGRARGLRRVRRTWSSSPRYRRIGSSAGRSSRPSPHGRCVAPASSSPGPAPTCRHAFASQMVRRDVPMKTVADLLGHARLETTTIYAKLDRETLRRSPCRGPEVHDDRRGLAAVLADLRRVAPRHRLQHATEVRLRTTSSSISNGAATTPRPRRSPSSGASASTESQHAGRLSIVRGFSRWSAPPSPTSTCTGSFGCSADPSGGAPTARRCAPVSPPRSPGAGAPSRAPPRSVTKR